MESMNGKRKIQHDDKKEMDDNEICGFQSWMQISIDEQVMWGAYLGAKVEVFFGVSTADMFFGYMWLVTWGVFVFFDFSFFLSGWLHRCQPVRASFNEKKLCQKCSARNANLWKQERVWLTCLDSVRLLLMISSTILWVVPFMVVDCGLVIFVKHLQ